MINYSDTIYTRPTYAARCMDSDLIPAGFAGGDACGFDESIPLATIFIRPQYYQCTYTPESALKYGTAFKELNRPYAG
ncbi:MAG: spore coat associated protein CotJA [Christensenellales bacterium]|jgi:hypothetical protein